MDIMTQECYEGTYFGAQHILDPANNSPWGWHTVAAMMAIGDNPKSWGHLATLPFPKLDPPFWDPNFTPPCGQLAAPYLHAHKDPGPKFKLCTLI